jgi:hypothetical protein
MKQSIIALSITLLLVTCKQKASQTDLNQSPSDTAFYNNSLGTQGAVGYPTTYPTTHTTARVYHHRTSYVSRSSYPAHTTVTRKKGWSSAAKGAVIGAGSGAVLGAVLSKDHHRVKGAVIGGAIGAAGGYLYGRHRDKKNRRY